MPKPDTVELELRVDTVEKLIAMMKPQGYRGARQMPLERRQAVASRMRNSLNDKT
jgi:hypothetical protein